MSFTDTSSVITSSYSSATTRSGVIFLAKVVIISSLVADFSVASSIGGGSSSTSVSGGGGGSGIGLDSIIGGGGSSSGSGGSSNVVGGSGSYYLGNEVWFRNLDTQLLRLGSRLDQLMIRMDHLDSRVGRVQSQGHLRFDSIETNMQTTRQRLDLWSNQLNLIEEQLSRKWKNMESRFDSLVTAIDSKLDTKFNLIQRDNRRHNEYISSSFNSVIISQEKLSERVVNSLSEMNSTVTKTNSHVSNATVSLLTRVTQECSLQPGKNNTFTNILSSFLSNFTLKSCPHNPIQHQQQHHPHHHNQPNRNSNLVGYEQLLPSSSSTSSQHYFHSTSYNSPHPQPNSTSQVQLVTSKVTNMFDELVKRSQSLEAIVKDTFTMSNVTRREVQDGFRALIPIVNQISSAGNNGGARSISSNGGASSAEVMSAMVVEALTSVESISTSLGRRMTELSRSIEERFEMVSMTLNGFLESCLRIQEKAPLIEEHIAMILERILDTVDNSTRNATETWQKIQVQLVKEQQQQQQQHPHHFQRHSHHSHQQSKRNTSSCSDNLIMASLQRSLLNQQQQSRFATSQGQNVNQVGTSSSLGRAVVDGEYSSIRNRSSARPVSPLSASTSWGGSLPGGEEDETGLEVVHGGGGGGSDRENIIVGAGPGNDEDEEHNNYEHLDGDERHDSGAEDESEEPSKLSRSKPVFKSSPSHQHHQHHHHHRHHQQRHLSRSNGGVASGGGGSVSLGSVNRHGNLATNLPDPYPIPFPSASNSEGAVTPSISGTNNRSPSQSFLTFSSHHNVNDNVDLAQQGLAVLNPPPSSLSSSSTGLLGARPATTTSDNNNGMGVVSSSSGNSARVSGNSNNHNHNSGDLPGGAAPHVSVDELSEEEKKRFWESWLSPHTPQRESVPE